jgi:hypothetical protein
MTITVNATQTGAAAALGQGSAGEADEQLTEAAAPLVGNRQLVVLPQANAEQPVEDEEGDLDFDWDDKETLVFRRQLAVAVYRNPEGALVIRQEPDWNEDCDTYIVISPENVSAFIERLTDVAGIPSIGGPEPSPVPVRKR